MSNVQYCATGRRKVSSARIWISAGNGRFSINNRPMDEYFAREVLRMKVKQPLNAVGKCENYDVIALVRGGGMSGQAGAIRHGVARALLKQSENSSRAILKKGGFLTRDSRMVERKKPGMSGARKRYQYSKR